MYRVLGGHRGWSWPKIVWPRIRHISGIQPSCIDQKRIERPRYTGKTVAVLVICKTNGLLYQKNTETGAKHIKSRYKHTKTPELLCIYPLIKEVSGLFISIEDWASNKPFFRRMVLLMCRQTSSYFEFYMFIPSVCLWKLYSRNRAVC